MTTETDERVHVLNPNTGRDDLRIARAVYEPVKWAILGALDRPDGLPNKALRSAVESATPGELWESHSLGWYTTVVKLDLEARGHVSVTGSPQHLSLTSSGRAELAGAR